MVTEVSRTMGAAGVFGFTVAVPDPDPGKHYVRRDTPWGVPIFAHSHEFITRLLQDKGFQMQKRQKLLMKGGPGNDPEMVFATYVATRGDG